MARFSAVLNIIMDTRILSSKILFERSGTGESERARLKVLRNILISVFFPSEWSKRFWDSSWQHSFERWCFHTLSASSFYLSYTTLLGKAVDSSFVQNSMVNLLRGESNLANEKYRNPSEKTQRIILSAPPVRLLVTLTYVTAAALKVVCCSSSISFTLAVSSLTRALGCQKYSRDQP